jgi:hypothetical protein
MGVWEVQSKLKKEMSYEYFTALNDVQSQPRQDGNIWRDDDGSKSKDVTDSAPTNMVWPADV